MNKIFATPALIAVMTAAGAANVHAGQQVRSVLLNCAGLERTQSAAPDDGAPDANSGAQSPDANPDGSTDDNAQSPNDGGSGDDDGANSDQDTPPDTAQPPGCIFQNKPLELLV